MEEQDQIIVKSLQRLKLPVTNSTAIETITYEQMMELLIAYLKKFADDLSVLKNYKKANQRYSNVLKIIGLLKKHEVWAEAAAIINPSPNTTRNLFLEIIAKSKFNDTEQIESTLTPFERIINEKKMRQKAILRNFTNRDWVHPELFEPNELAGQRQAFGFLDFEKFEKKGFKEKVVALVRNSQQTSFIDAIGKFGQFRDDRNFKKDLSVAKAVDKLVKFNSEKTPENFFSGGVVVPKLQGNVQMYIGKIREKNLGSYQTFKGRRGAGLDSAGEQLTNEQRLALIGGVSEDGLKRVNLGLITGLEEEMPYKAGPQRPRLAPEERQRSELSNPVISSEIHAESDSAHLTEEERQATMNAENLEKFKQAEVSKLDSFKSEKKAEIEALTGQIDSHNS
jgi:hypothetical protein